MSADGIATCSGPIVTQEEYNNLKATIIDVHEMPCTPEHLVVASLTRTGMLTQEHDIAPGPQASPMFGPN